MTEGPEVLLETERLILRRFTMADAQLLEQLDSDPDVMRYINGGTPSTEDEVLDYLKWWLTYHDRGPVYGFYAAIEKATGEFVGWFHFRPGEGAGPLEPELGYRLVQRAWGRGLASEGSRALVEFAFKDLAVERVYATTMAINVASRRVMEKAGLRFVRLFSAEDWPIRIPGDEEGDVEYALTRAEWESEQAD
jgi:RimJ/RimL family protein N-acetyltransferase